MLVQGEAKLYQPNPLYVEILENIARDEGAILDLQAELDKI